MDLGRVIREARAGRVEFRIDKTGVIHGPVGKLSFNDDQLLDNLGAFVDAIVRAKHELRNVALLLGVLDDDDADWRFRLDA